MSEEKLQSGFYKIKPAGRHILTIGKDLIKDKYAAIVELVKNAYDADASTCIVSLKPFYKKDNEGNDIKGINIAVSDDGHGMDYDTVINKWMVPSTDDKLKRKMSPGGRTLQGRKGVGRYAASILGEDLVLQTIDEKQERTTLYLIWEHFEKAIFLDDVNVLIESFKTENRKSGTALYIVGGEEELVSWNDKQIRDLNFELKKLLPPLEDEVENDDKFKIILELGEFGFLGPEKREIEPFPLFDLYDYRISGTVSEAGKAILKFENKRLTTDDTEIINNFEIKLDGSEQDKGSYCGEVKIDFRVFDRDPQSIDNLIERGLKDPITNGYVGKREARIILDTFNGIGVYRNGFRIRPLGDAGYDWLELDRERVQNPAQRIGSDQIIGFVHIKSEEESGLEEKSARDGLKETPQYSGLKQICTAILNELETRRFSYRKMVGLGRTKRGVNDKINTLYNFDDLKQNINKELKTLGVSEEKIGKINSIIAEKETKNNKIADELKQIIALYQGQATLGNIVNVIMHEGHKPLSYFINQIPILEELVDELRGEGKTEVSDKIINKINSFQEQILLLTNLFKKLDPLAARKNSKKKDFNVRDSIEGAIEVFSKQIKDKKIAIDIDCAINQTFWGWKGDFYSVFTNLIDNSVYWLKNIENGQKISFKVYDEEDILIIEYRDNGPGISKDFIESEVIFEPEFSGKNEGGMGLGLAIAGEAIERNGGSLKAVYSESGVFFKIELKME